MTAGARRAHGRALAPRLIAITDRTRWDAPTLVERADRLARRAQPGTLLVLLRDKHLPARERLDLGRRLRAVTRTNAQGFGVADRLDLALLLDADGVHLGEGSVSPREAREVVGADGFLSRACHAVAPLAAEDLREVDALLLSPIVAARKGRAALGAAAIQGLRGALAAAGAGHVGVYGLGGVDADSAGACLTAGARGVAAIGAAFAPDPEPLLAALGIVR
ncbi:MAG TPA: thiamine phosphate synthase [Polyangiaceae bacterium]|nr:thiamine phosphate synthase [Polyangiaceae bacterium]